ncbi:ATP-binding cassette domain-containing protein [Streptomyces sp. NBC_00878]|uniref:ATP-binding cassette domain-containing protein n=1 Tax=Streptomyces sp. NBC_00878 TaxID=2975854 RepID=UPI002250E79D|nr:ATP-binding cassette domain-containing protein [Streptomyces sp. NBC_00878]MCX4911172.1 ATP-binding cassette domain-containing protein [Streptomyces sp. NBC_00878]
MTGTLERELPAELPAEPLLVADDVVVEYPSKGWRKPPFRVLKGVSITIGAGETLGLVGESGSGKTTLGRAVLGLAPVASGAVRYRGKVISGLGRKERRALSDDIQVVFQDPYTSLNPAMTVTDILSEPLRVAGTSRTEAERRVRDLLDQVRLPADAGERLPREFSGGQRQRIAIARALSRDPRVIVCDEPVSALDLSTQARVLDLFVEIQERTGVAYLFVTHDLSVVRHISHRVAVMCEGEIVETGDAARITTTPEHPYTQRLLLAAPVPDPGRQAERRAERQRLAAAMAADASAGVSAAVSANASTKDSTNASTNASTIASTSGDRA